MVSSPSLSLNPTRHGLPNLCGRDAEIDSLIDGDETVFLRDSDIDLDRVQSGFACALHMHQPTIPAGRDGALISNLQYMFEHPGEGDNHNAGPFAWCYARMGEIIPALVHEGCSPRIMLDYSGNLLWGLIQMERWDIIDGLKRITLDRAYQPHVEWLGTMWSHAVVPSTPIPDIKLHIRAWRHYFASIFGVEALARVKGFSPPEMGLPNHPDTLYQYVKALKECGYRWLLVQEHSVETLAGESLPHDGKYIPNRLVARNSEGETVTITALIKTQGSDTKLVAQMQPYHEAKTRGRQTVGGVSIPSLVSQIADGENGGVMMNEFPRDFPRPWYEMRSGSPVAGFNGTEYLELITAAGVNPEDYPACQGVGQHKIWNLIDGDYSREKVTAAIDRLKATDHTFHTDGASWTNDLSWVRGYENVLEPMNLLSAKFHERYDPSDAATTEREDYLEALLYNLLLQTSCFRYWGQGTWTEYARKIYSTGINIIK